MLHSNLLKSKFIPLKIFLFAVVTLFFLASAATVFCAEILLITGTRPYAGDAAILENLESRGFSVSVVSDRDASISDALEKDLVVISESVYSKRINTTFRNLPVPIIVSEPWLFHYMGMAGSTYGTDFGNARRRSAITLTEFPHQMTAEMTGSVSITYRRRALAWGLAGKGAIKIATLIDDTNRCPIFAYDKGAQMPGMVAPDKRVGFFLHRNTAAYLTPEGWALFEAAVDWCLMPVPPVPVTFTIVSDQSWKACAGEGCNNVKIWPATPEAPSHWKQAATGFAHLKHPSEMRPDTEAEKMWFCPPGVDPQSSSIPSMAYFHKTFNLPCNPQQITKALAYVANPGKLSLYINGHPILVEGPTLGEGGKPRVFNIRHALQEDHNVIAIVAQCGEAAKKYVFLDMAIEAMMQATNDTASMDKTLLVVGRTLPNYSDRQIKMRLERSGHLVEVIDDNQLEQAEMADLKLIVISESVWSQLVGERFTSIDIPVICFESYLYDDLKMTAAQPKKDYGNWRRQDTIYLNTVDEPIAADHQGQVRVTSRSRSVGWGIPAKSATIIAFLNRFSDKATIFTYDKNAQLVDGMPAPARRVGMFPHKNSAKWFTDSGWALFDAAVVWATQE
ncbi:MAG: hypothetical protein QNJ26_11150 [Desulfobacterales bacterium]|nr:hypothetical protein [Desulfobacterales bacterium]